MTVTPLSTVSPVHAAWARYQALALRFRDNPSLASDIGFCAEQARAYREWQNLFLGRAA